MVLSIHCSHNIFYAPKIIITLCGKNSLFVTIVKFSCNKHYKTEMAEKKQTEDRNTNYANLIFKKKNEEVQELEPDALNSNADVKASLVRIQV